MIGAGLAWLSGAVVGLGAVFSAFGFLVVLSYAHMLGVEIRRLRYDYTYYLQCGASFFVSLIVETAGLLFLTLMLVLAVLVIFRGCRGLCQKFAIEPPLGVLSVIVRIGKGPPISACWFFSPSSSRRN